MENILIYYELDFPKGKKTLRDKTQNIWVVFIFEIWVSVELIMNILLIGYFVNHSI